jgi:hypothetical protein
MTDVIKYKKPSAKARAAGQGSGATITKKEYKGFTISSCLIGGWHIMLHEAVIEHVRTIAEGKTFIDKWAGYVATHQL